MNCRTAREQMIDLFDAGNPAAGEELREHLVACAECVHELERMTATLAAITPDLTVRASADFKERTMNRLTERLAANAAANPSGRGVFRRPLLRWGWVPVAAAIAIVFALPYFASRDASSSPVKLLAQSSREMEKLQSVHLIGRIRTLPGETFEFVGANHSFVPIEMWKQFGATPRWRVEKPGRVAVMDGKNSLLLFGGDQAVRGGPNNGFVEQLLPLLDAETVLAGELAEARAGHLNPTLTVHEHNGARRLLLTVAHPAKGSRPGDWTHNQFILESDHTRSYTFDAGTSRLTGLRIMMRDGGESITILEITDIRYNEVFDEKLFDTQVPANYNLVKDAGQLPTANRPLPATPREAAVAFFEGMAKSDWEQVSTVWTSTITDGFKQAGGLTVVSIGQPFQSGLYAGWFVPYEIRFPDGSTKKLNLSVRNDNPAKRWVVDGGY